MTWFTVRPQFTECFQRCIVFVPFGFLVVSLPFYLLHIRIHHKQNPRLQHSWLNISQTVSVDIFLRNYHFTTVDLKEKCARSTRIWPLKVKGLNEALWQPSNSSSICPHFSDDQYKLDGRFAGSIGFSEPTKRILKPDAYSLIAYSLHYIAYFIIAAQSRLYFLDHFR